MLAGRTNRHGAVAASGLIVCALSAVTIGLVDPGTFGLILLMATAGLFNGLIMPSRDMLVREVTPPGSFGKVFGFVTTGFNIGGILSPLIYGAVMDYNNPGAVSCSSASAALIAILAAVRPQPAPAEGYLPHKPCLLAAPFPDAGRRGYFSSSVRRPQDRK